MERRSRGGPVRAIPPMRGGDPMKLLMLVATSVGGAVGWSLGSAVGPMTAFFLSVVGSGVGLWGAARFGREFRG
jgi:hypothetical protein